jgi:hypothetical protein
MEYDNPYLEAFQSLQEQSGFRGEQWFGKRKELVEKYSWAVPNEEVLTYLSKFSTIQEWGAGNGYWTDCIIKAGGCAEPYDLDPPAETWCSVQEADVHNVVQEQPENVGDVVLTVWPPLGEARVGFTLLETEPDHFLYVGEQMGGCTGSDKLFVQLQEQYGLVKEIEIPSYEGVHDNFYHYVRNTV